MTLHKPALLPEVIDYLNLQPNQNVIDCTLGGGGHTEAMLERVGPSGRVLAIDEDQEAIERFKFKVKSLKLKVKGRIRLVNDNFRNLKEIINEQRFYNPISACLLDLGLSSDQLDTSGRGFTFQRREPLDMRFGSRSAQSREQGQLTAGEIINMWTQADLERIFRQYGEEPRARQIAKQIVDQRKKQVIETTEELTEIISSSNSPRTRRPRTKLNPATKVFQALRIAVNDELESLRQVLPQALEVLESGGRLTVISFHGLEDRIVKDFFRNQAQDKILKIITKKPVVPSREEVKENPRTKSAKLRVAERTLKH